jgi:anti-anti-sigma factor
MDATGSPGRPSPESERSVLDVDPAGPSTYRLTGVLDFLTSPRLERALARARTRLVLDLAGLEFMDSVGLRALIRIAQRLEGEVVLRNPSTAIRRALWLTGFGEDTSLGLRVEESGSGELASASDFLRGDPIEGLAEPELQEEPEGERVR